MQTIKDCKTTGCYNEVYKNADQVCFDCINRQKEDLARTGAHWLHVEYPTVYDRRGKPFKKEVKLTFKK